MNIKPFFLFIMGMILIYSCEKENLIIIEPFKNFSPQERIDGQSAHIFAILPTHRYDEVGITYSFEKAKLTKGMAVARTLMIGSDDGYRCTIDQLLYNTTLLL